MWPKADMAARASDVRFPGAERTSARVRRMSADDPFETWATKDFRSAKAYSSRFAKRDIVLSIGWV